MPSRAAAARMAAVRPLSGATPSAGCAAGRLGGVGQRRRKESRHRAQHQRRQLRGQLNVVGAELALGLTLLPLTTRVRQGAHGQQAGRAGSLHPGGSGGRVVAER